MRFSALFFIFFLVLTSSCSDNLSKYGDLFAQFMLTEEGLLRGLELGYSYDKVSQIEEIAPEKSDSDFMLFSGVIGKSGVY